MNIEKWISKIFLPDDESWLRHANPWSIWTRFVTLPFIVLAFWFRIWLGWYCVIPVSVLVIWIIVNPRLFKKPANFNSWGSKAVLGERIYIKRKEEPIPSGHNTPVAILTILQTIGGGILIYGVWSLNVYLTVHGLTFVYLTKMWFLDRMVWLYEDSYKNA